MKTKQLNEEKKPVAERVISICLHTLGIPIPMWASKRRFNHVAEARHIIRHILVTHVGMLQRDAGFMTDCDHTTIIHSVKQCEAFIVNDSEFRKKYNQCIGALYAAGLQFNSSYNLNMLIDKKNLLLAEVGRVVLKMQTDKDGSLQAKIDELIAQVIVVEKDMLGY